MGSSAGLSSGPGHRYAKEQTQEDQQRQRAQGQRPMDAYETAQDTDGDPAKGTQA
jgi:hypothetical protein